MPVPPPNLTGRVTDIRSPRLLFSAKCFDNIVDLVIPLPSGPLEALRNEFVRQRVPARPLPRGTASRSNLHAKQLIRRNTMA